MNPQLLPMTHTSAVEAEGKDKILEVTSQSAHMN